MKVLSYCGELLVTHCVWAYYVSAIFVMHCAILLAPSPIVSSAFDIVFATPIVLNAFRLNPVVLLASWLSISTLHVCFDSGLVLFVPGTYSIDFVAIHNVFAVPNVLDDSQLLW